MCSITTVNFRSALNENYICAWDLWGLELQHIKLVSVGSQRTLSCTFHKGHCLAHWNRSLKVCRTAMNLTSFLGFSQVIIKPSASLGQQLTPTQEWMIYRNAVWCFALSRSYDRSFLQNRLAYRQFWLHRSTPNPDNGNIAGLKRGASF